MAGGARRAAEQPPGAWAGGGGGQGEGRPPLLDDIEVPPQVQQRLAQPRDVRRALCGRGAGRCGKAWSGGGGFGPPITTMWGSGTLIQMGWGGSEGAPSAPVVLNGPSILTAVYSGPPRLWILTVSKVCQFLSTTRQNTNI